MPSKRGSKVAAAQARAKAAAKKKARQGASTLPATSYITPVTEAEEEEEENQQGVAPAEASVAVQSKTEAAGARTQAVRAISMRRERHAAPSQVGASLRRELGMIGGLASFTGVVLVILKLVMHIGS